MPPSSKQLVQALFTGKQVSRPPFIPCIASAAARFMQVPVKQLFSDPTTLANSFQACQSLFKYDGVVILFDSTLVAEACGCTISWAEDRPPEIKYPVVNSADELESLSTGDIESKGRIPVILEAAGRLSQTIGRDVALLGVITGPVTLGRHLMGEAFDPLLQTNNRDFEKLIDSWGKIALALARSYGELKMDGVVIAEKSLASIRALHYSAIQPVLKTLCNLVRFYDAPVIIHIGDIDPMTHKDVLQLEADGYTANADVLEQSDLRWPPGKLCGRAIPSSTFYGSDEEVESAILQLIKGTGDSRFYLTSEWEIPQATHAANLHKVRQVLDKISIK